MILLSNRRGNAAVNYPDGLEHENAIDALAATRFLAVQAFTRDLDGVGITIHLSLCTEQWLTAHIRNKKTLRQPDDDSLAAPKKFSEKLPSLNGGRQLFVTCGGSTVSISTPPRIYYP